MRREKHCGGPTGMLTTQRVCLGHDSPNQRVPKLPGTLSTRSKGVPLEPKGKRSIWRLRGAANSQGTQPSVAPAPARTRVQSAQTNTVATNAQTR